MPVLSGVELSGAAQATVINSASFPSVSTFRASLTDASHLLPPSIVAVTVNPSAASRANIGTITLAEGSSIIEYN